MYLSSKHLISSLAFHLILTLSPLQFLFYQWAECVSNSIQAESLPSGGDVRCLLSDGLQYCSYPVQLFGRHMLQSFWVLDASLEGTWPMFLCPLFSFVSLELQISRSGWPKSRSVSVHKGVPKTCLFLRCSLNGWQGFWVYHCLPLQHSSCHLISMYLLPHLSTSHRCILMSLGRSWCQILN